MLRGPSSLLLEDAVLQMSSGVGVSRYVHRLGSLRERLEVSAFHAFWRLTYRSSLSDERKAADTHLTLGGIRRVLVLT
jgi:hypothetical protein